MDAKTTGCPVAGSPLSDHAKEPRALRSLLGRTNRDWWPNQLSLDILHQQGRTGDPMGDDFDYTEAFKKLDYEAVKRAARIDRRHARRRHPGAEVPRRHAAARRHPSEVDLKPRRCYCADGR